jgi:telomerase reverse transcriptase
MILLGKSLGTSYLRLVPKLSGIRPIVNMGRKQEGGKASINKQLENAFHIIKLGKRQNPALFGSSVFGMDDIYKVFAPFAENHRQQHMDKPLFFVSLDISGCFDNLDHAKVMGVCQQLLCEDEYQIRRYTSVMMSNDELRIEFKRDADVLGLIYLMLLCLHVISSL